ncbi:MFS transporter [Radiobacillus deserti]|uniref:MFS transporter n=1 Tax=Radiobacillus deserti TaxID=2594883 RepID=A0A516KKM7_9BACI|nr:MFS transporter [Radiobacillus deserti]QDP41945.1 MFS transporter [Radiobacillus deserti]
MNTQRWMSVRFFSFFLTWGIFLPYWSGWMIHTKGITVSQASFIMSFGLLARGISTLFAFPYLSGIFSSKQLLRIAGIGSFLAIICYIPAHSFSSLLFVTIVLHLFYPTLMPALDSAAGVLVQSNQLKHYGRSRQWGSIGFVSIGMLITIFTGYFGDEVILWALLLGVMGFVWLTTMRAPEVLSAKPEPSSVDKESILQVFRIRHFGLVLIIVLLLQSAHATYYNYGYIYLQEIDAPTYLIGVIINIAVLAEILFFFIADKHFGNFSVGALLTIAAIGSTIRWILVFAFPSVVIFCIAQTLHALSFAMAHYAFMKYVVAHVPPTHIAKVQGVYSALALSWGTALFTIFGGFLYEVEPRYAFIGMVICTIPSLLLALYYRRLEQNKEVFQSI